MAVRPKPRGSWIAGGQAQGLLAHGVLYYIVRSMKPYARLHLVMFSHGRRRRRIVAVASELQRSRAGGRGTFLCRRRRVARARDGGA
jgi:hypothetical protein